MRTHLLDAVEEGLDASVERFERHCSEHVKAIHEMPSVDKGLDAVGAHELGTVEQGEALFGFEFYRFPSEDI